MPRSPATQLLSAFKRQGVLLQRLLWCLTAACVSTAALSHSAIAADSSFASDTLAALQSQTGPAQATAYEFSSIVLPGRDTPATQQLMLTRWMTPDAPRSLGVSVGWTPSAPHHLPHAWPHTASQNLDLGVRWRSQFSSRRHLDISAWAQAPETHAPPDVMGMIWEKQQPTFGTRVEVQWASSRTRGLIPEFGAIGVQLQGGSRLVLRAKKGGPMLYYRARF